MIIETRRLAFTDDSLIDAVTVALGSGVIKGPRVPVVRSRRTAPGGRSNKAVEVLSPSAGPPRPLAVASALLWRSRERHRRKRPALIGIAADAVRFVPSATRPRGTRQDTGCEALYW